eukprot:gene21535-28526_t
MFERMTDARAVLTRWVPVFKARLVLLRARRQARIRMTAAATIQSVVRMRQAQKLAVLKRASITRIQALWRGQLVRRQAVRSFAELRKRMATSRLAADKAPHKRMGVRVQEAVAILLSRKQPEQFVASVSWSPWCLFSDLFVYEPQKPTARPSFDTSSTDHGDKKTETKDHHAGIR